MFPHEEYLTRALEHCMITQLVQDLAGLYVELTAANTQNTDEDFRTALQVCKILNKAAEEIAALGAKPKISS